MNNTPEERPLRLDEQPQSPETESNTACAVLDVPGDVEDTLAADAAAITAEENPTDQCPSGEHVEANEEPVAQADDGPAAASVIEALLFSSDGPLSAAKIADMVGTVTPSVVRKHIESLNEKYEQCGMSFRIEAIARGFQMLTTADYHQWVIKLNKHRNEARLSGAALEALSIVAYKQPVIRADVEAIRGVACGEVISRLREMGLVRVLGRADIVGRPLLYGTTRKFLDVFGLADLDDLPPMEALKIKPVSKPVDEVEPIQPPPIPEPPAENETPEVQDLPRQQVAVAGA